MSRSLKIVGVTVVLAGLLAVGGSYAVGFFFKKDFQERVERTNRWWQTYSNGRLSVQVGSYDSGLFGATARTRVTLKDETILTVKHDIRYGLGAGLVSFGTIHSEPEVPQDFYEMTRAVFGSDVFGGKSPLTVDSTIGWTGSQRIRIESPRIAGKAAGVVDIDWGGIDGEISMDSGHKSIAWRIEVPGLTIAEGSNKVEVGRLYTTGDTVRPEARSFRLGQMEAGLDKFVAHIEKSRLQNDFPVVEIGNMKLSSDSRANGETVDSTATFSIGKALAEDVAIDEAKWVIAVENIDADALDRLVQLIEAAYGDKTQAQALFEALKGQELAAAFLRRKPVIALKEASLRMPQGEFRASIRASYIGENPDQFDPERDLALDVEGSVSRPLIVYLLRREASKQMAAIDDAQTEEVLQEFVTQLVEQQVDQQINEMTEKGVFVEKDGVLTATLHIQGKTRILNGKSLDEKEIGGLFSPSRP